MRGSWEVAWIDYLMGAILVGIVLRFTPLGSSPVLMIGIPVALFLLALLVPPAVVRLVRKRRWRDHAELGVGVRFLLEPQRVADRRAGVTDWMAQPDLSSRHDVDETH